MTRMQLTVGGLYYTDFLYRSTFEVMVVTLLDHLNRFIDHGHLPKLCDNKVT